MTPGTPPSTLPPARELRVKSSLDHTDQPARCWPLAPGFSGPRPLLVVLHTWSGSYLSPSGFVDEGYRRGWLCVMPNFRGRNDQPDACASPRAVRDVVDAVDFMLANHAIAADRVYVVGGSGGGHMTLTMASAAPGRFAAASSWCPISDLAAWHREHVKEGQPDNYGKEIRLCTGGQPGESPAIDAQFAARSPLLHLATARDLPLDINHGILDGKTGSVPIHHAIDAFNVLASTVGGQQISGVEHDQLWTAGRLARPQPQDTQPDADYLGRAIFLRRQAGKCRLTIYDGGHEMLPYAACQFLAKFTKSGKPVTDPPIAPPMQAGTMLGR